MNGKSPRYPNRLRELIEKTGVKQKDLERFTGVPQPLISLYANGQRRMSLETAAILAQALGCRVDDLLMALKTERSRQLPIHFVNEPLPRDPVVQMTLPLQDVARLILDKAVQDLGESVTRDQKKKALRRLTAALEADAANGAETTLDEKIIIAKLLLEGSR